MNHQNEKIVKIEDLKPNDHLFVWSEFDRRFVCGPVNYFRDELKSNPDGYGKAYLAEKAKPLIKFEHFREYFLDFLDEENINDENYIYNEDESFEDVIDKELVQKIYDLTIELLEKSERFQRQTEIEVDWSSLKCDDESEQEISKEPDLGIKIESLRDVMEELKKCKNIVRTEILKKIRELAVVLKEATEKELSDNDEI